MKTSIITGGAGFIGSNLARRLLDEGGRVIIIDDLSTGILRNIPDGALFYQADISNANLLLSLDLPDNVDTVFHLAAQSSGEASFEDPRRDIDVNYKGTFNVLELCNSVHCSRFVYTSSMSVYGEPEETASLIDESYPCRPKSYYGCNKYASEKLIHLYSNITPLKPTIFRLFNVFGPGQNMLNLKQGMASIYLSYIMRNEPILVKGSLDRFRDFIYVDDVGEALTRCQACQKSYYKTFNVGTGVKTSVGQLLRVILEAYGKKAFDEWVIREGRTAGDVTGLIADNHQLMSALNWEARVDLKTGIGNMVKWIEGTKDFWR